MPFKFVKDYLPDFDTSKELLTAEIKEAESCSDPQTKVRLDSRDAAYLARSFIQINGIDDLDQLTQTASDGNVFGFSDTFDPKLVDGCLVRGIFPITLQLGNEFIFFPKLHKERMICTPLENPSMRKEIEYFPPCDGNEGVFCVERLNNPKEFLEPANDVAGTTCFDVFVNRKEDLVDVFSLIHQQHGENWVCKALRKCFFYIQSHEGKFKSRMVTIALRRHKYEGGSDQLPSFTPDEVKEGDLIAAEVGYIVGDIYTSATGAYCVSGAGKLQLAVTGCILRELGCKVWDLGMFMNYKDSLLGCVKIEREDWIQMVKQRREYSILDDEKSKKYLLELQKGKGVSEILKDSTKTL